MDLNTVKVKVGETVVEGYLINDTTYVPLRKVIDAVQLEVTWLPSTGATVVFKKD